MLRRARARGRALALAAIVAGAALARATPAEAHTGLRASSPRAGATVPDTLGRIRLEFTTRVAAGMTSLVVNMLMLGLAINVNAGARSSDG